MKHFKEKHLRANSNEYLDATQVNQELSYYITSKPRNVGGRFVYQYITMNDGTIYELFSVSNSTNGIIANNCRLENMLQRDIKRMAINAIIY